MNTTFKNLFKLKIVRFIGITVAPKEDTSDLKQCKADFLSKKILNESKLFSVMS